MEREPVTADESGLSAALRRIFGSHEKWLASLPNRIWTQHANGLWSSEERDD